jgi:hypothetical protein
LKKYNHRIVYWGGIDNTIIPRAAQACGTGTGGAGSAAAAGSSVSDGQSGPQEPQAGAEGSTWDKIKAALPILAAGALALAAIGGAIAVLKKKPPKVKATTDDAGNTFTGPPTDPPDSTTPSLNDIIGGLDDLTVSDPPVPPNGSPPSTPTPFTDIFGNIWEWIPNPAPGFWQLKAKGDFQPIKLNLPDLPTKVDKDGKIYQWYPDPPPGQWNEVGEEDLGGLTKEDLLDGGWDILGATLTTGPPDGTPNGDPPPVTSSPFTDEDGNVWVWEDPNWILDTVPEYVGQEIVDGNGNLWKYKDPPGIWINFGPVEPRFRTTGQGAEVPIYEPYATIITGVQNNTQLMVSESWAAQGERIGHLASTFQATSQNPFDQWKITYPVGENDLYTYLLFDENKSNLIINYHADEEKYKEYPHSIVYKLYEELPEGIELGDLCYVVKEMAPPYTETIRLIDFVEEDIDAVLLRNPKWDTDFAVDSYVNVSNTKYKSYDSLVTSDINIKEQIENEIISGSFMESIELTGLDFRQWDNFVHFSSVEDRLKNFKTKLQRIELYTSQSDSLSGISGSLTYEQTASLEMKVRKIKNEFVPFESYMYFQSSSYITSSLGEFFDNTWPKKSGTGTKLDPYVVNAVTESASTTWYDEQISSASLYDRRNRNRLLGNIPDHIINDDRNLPFHTFINMTGEHFDNIWTYINEIPQIYDRREKLTEGLSRDLIYAVGTSLGFYLNDGKSLIDLPRYLLGQEATGSGANANSFTSYSTIAERDISREIWKRLINNMPFFLKTKGTLRSFKGLINCYGIPSSILYIKEYGGPDPDPNAQPSYAITRNFTKAIDFKAGQYVETTWVNDTNSGRKPDTIEFRFKAASGSNQTLFQVGTTHGFAIRLKDNGSSDNIGSVSFVLNASAGSAAELISNSLPIYDGEFYSVMLNRVSSSGAQLTADTTSQQVDYRLYVKKYDEGRSKIYLSSYTTMTIDGATSSSWNSSFVGNETAYIGGKSTDDFGNQLSGSMMEFRYWNSALNSGSFDNHVKAPKSFAGNHASASWTDLVLRYSFDDNSNLDEVTSIRDTSADQSYIQAGTATGYTSGNRPHFSSVVDEEQTLIPNVGPNRRVSNKIRLESSKLVFGGLSVDKRAELSSYDQASLDSNKLGIYFSPVDVINEDIVHSIANLDFDQYIGDPRDKYKYRYRTLEDVATTYWQKYLTPNNFWDYIRLIRYYDNSLFEQLRKFVPAHARASVGLLIEPNILERKKEVIGKQPIFEDLAIRGAVNMHIHSASAENIPVTASISQYLLPTLSGSYTKENWEGSASFFDTTIPSGSYITYNGEISSSMHKPALYQLSSSINSDFGYGVYDITKGGPTYIFEEALQPIITGSRLSEHNYEYKFFYTTKRSALEDHGYTWDTERKNYDSRSLHRSDIQSVGHDNAYFRLAYSGCLQTKNTTLDKLEPVTITITSPTTLVTQEPGISKLQVK